MRPGKVSLHAVLGVDNECDGTVDENVGGDADGDDLDCVGDDDNGDDDAEDCSCGVAGAASAGPGSILLGLAATLVSRRRRRRHRTVGEAPRPSH